jgi:hypothetical protein
MPRRATNPVSARSRVTNNHCSLMVRMALISRHPSEKAVSWEKNELMPRDDACGQ